MHPIILHTSDSYQKEAFINSHLHKNAISPSHTSHIYPEKSKLRIDQIRIIKKHLIHKQSHIQLIVIHDFDTATTEAQNAFLKTLEEHGPLTHFILTVSRVHNLLPTITSRARIIRKHSTEPETQDRMMRIDHLLLEEKQEQSSAKILSDKSLQVKTAEEAYRILDACISHLRTSLQSDNLYIARRLKRIIELRSLLERNNGNPQLTVDMSVIEMIRKYHA